jgi:hypothetical protein
VYTCTLSRLASVVPLWCVVECIRQLEVCRRVTSLTRFVLFCCLWFETGPFLLFVVGWSFFNFVASSYPLMQCFLVQRHSIQTSQNGTCPKLLVWEACLWVPHHLPSFGAAMIGQVKFPSQILQIPGEKLSVAPPANFTIRQQRT